MKDLKRIEKIKQEKERLYQLSLFITENFNEEVLLTQQEKIYSKFIIDSKILKKDSLTLTKITNLNIDDDNSTWKVDAEEIIGIFIEKNKS